MYFFVFKICENFWMNEVLSYPFSGCSLTVHLVAVNLCTEEVSLFIQRLPLKPLGRVWWDTVDDTLGTILYGV